MRGDQRHAPAALPPEKRFLTICIGYWVGPGPVWTGASTGTRCSDRPANSASLYSFSRHVLPALCLRLLFTEALDCAWFVLTPRGAGQSFMKSTAGRGDMMFELVSSLDNSSKTGMLDS